ncbi:MAG: hypothetical protein PCFJNLEI_00745 [Verrucomicrobiae bacterium]|nr:hypothetical protein [Verrucomicrobiae bacterium]
MGEHKTYKTRFQDRAKARKYAHRFEQGAHKRINQREQKAVREIFAGLNGIQRIVDVPSGAGRFAPTLGQNGRILVEIDSAHEMLVFANERAVQAGLRTICLQGDASVLPLGTASVDCVFCNRLLHHIYAGSERLAFLREFHRVTRRYLVISFFDYHLFGSLRRALKKLKGRNPNYHEQPTREQFYAEVAQAGFQVTRLVPAGPFWVAEKYLVLEKL